jgi:hypothetical protein
MLRLTCLLLLSFIADTVFATPDSLQVLLAKMDKYRKTYPQEKVHLHFDKPFYTVGDTVYFKAYIVNAEKNKPSLLSNILHVDLLDNTNSVKKSVTLPLEEGLGWGDFLLADTLAEGAYTVHAYTNWMRNFDSSFFFTKKIMVGNAFSNNVAVKATYKLEKATDKEMKAGADLSFLSLKGQPFAGKQVSYVVKVSGKEIAKANAVTDKNGLVQVAFTADKQALESGKTEIISTIGFEHQKKAVKTVHFNAQASNNSISFFPEGGNLIEGLANKVGFKVVDGSGKGAAASGIVVDKLGNNVVEFETGFAGMGSFSFTPQTGEEYYAHLKLGNKAQLKQSLPKAIVKGYVLSVENVADNDKLALKVNASKDFSGTEFTVVAQTNGAVQYQTKASLAANGWSINLSKKRFPTGILQITLFNTLYQPVAERLVFILHNDQMSINVSVPKNNYSKREKVKLSFVTNDSMGNGLTSSLSVSVIDETKVPSDEAKEQTIYSDLLLSSDLKGYIEQPNYYFTGDKQGKEKELDNLMLTQGWRRFTWTDLLAQKYPPILYNKEKGLQLSGRVLTSKGDAVANAKVRLMSKGGEGFIIDTTADSDGFFVFNELFYTDDMPYLVQARTSKGLEEDLVVQMDKDTKPLVNDSGLLAGFGTDSEAMSAYLLSSNQRFEELRKQGLLTSTKVLENVTVNAKKITKIQEAVRPSFNLNGAGNADQIFTYMDMRNCHTLASCLQGRLTGVVFKADGGARIFAYSSQAMTRGMGLNNTLLPPSPMLLVIDGVPRPDFAISDLAVQDIQAIEVLRGVKGNVYGLKGSNGVLVITTKQGGIDYNEDVNAPSVKQEILKGAYFGSAQGFYTARQFYSPAYSGANANSQLPDLRTTICWRPNVYTDEDGEANIEFYNADGVGKYKVVVEGISPTGKIGRKVFYYEVR